MQSSKEKETKKTSEEILALLSTLTAKVCLTLSPSCHLQIIEVTIEIALDKVLDRPYYCGFLSCVLSFFQEQSLVEKFKSQGGDL